MALATTYTRAQLGLEAPLVTVEVDLSNGLPSCTIVGLPETAVRESRDRVRAAITNSGFEFPARRITINLAPAELPKQGGRYDLAIAVGILLASGQLESKQQQQLELIGELSLSGRLTSSGALLPAALACRQAQRQLMVPSDAQAQVAPTGCTGYLANTLLEVAGALAGNTTLAAIPGQDSTLAPTAHALDFADVKGQPQAKRALLIAACGGHNTLLSGPPGSGKTMLAQRLNGILPMLDEEQALEVASIQSLDQQDFKPQSWRQRPFRSPHHNASMPALIGGGSPVRPGEVSLAHHGVLFMDELPEFSRSALEALREPLENGCISIARANQRLQLPARCQLIAAMNPCPCGHHGDPNGNCRCTTEQVQRYRNRLSGPLLDRIDLHIHVQKVGFEALASQQMEASSAVLAEHVQVARNRQQQRQGCLNRDLHGQQLTSIIQLGSNEQALLQQASTKLNLSARAHHRILRVARSIADLDNAPQLTLAHLSEALQLRQPN